MNDAVLRVGGDLTELEQALGQVQALFARANRTLSAQVSQQASQAARGYVDLAKRTTTAAAAQRSLAGAAGRAATSLRGIAATAAVQNLGAISSASVRAARGLGSLRVSVNRVSRTLNQTRTESESLIGTLGRLAIAYGAFRGLRAAIAGPLQAGADIEALRVQLEGIQGSGARARRSLDWITTFPGRVEGFTDAFKQLQAFGINPLNGSLAKLNDFTAQIGAGQQRLERITRALGQGYAANALRAEELNQLIDAGVPIFQLFSDALGVAAGDVRQLAADGKLGRREIELLIDEMGRVSEGAALRSLGTLSGILGSLKIEANAFSAAIAGSGLQAFVTEQANAFRRLLAQFQQSGRLDALAQRFSNALESIVRGLLALISRVAAGFIQLTESGDLENYATRIGGALEALSVPLGVLVGNLATVTRGLAVFKVGISSVQAGALAASVLGIVAAMRKLIPLVLRFGLVGSFGAAATAAATLAFNVRLVGTAIQSVGIAKFIGQLVTGTFTLGSLNGALLAFRASVLKTLKTVALFSAGFVALAVAAGAVFYALQEAKQEAERMERVIRETNAAADEYIKTVRELRGAGLDEQADTLREISNLWRQGRVSTEDFLSAIRNVGGEALEVNATLATERQKLADLYAAKEAEVQAKILNAERTRLTASIEAGRQNLAEKKRLLGEAEKAEQESTQRLIELRQQLAGQSQSLEDRISDIRRRGMSDRQASYRAESEAIQNTLEVSRLVVLARQAETEAERAALLEQAKARQQRAEQLAGEVDSITRQESLARRLNDTQKTLLKEEIDLQEDRQTAARESSQTLAQQIEEEQAKLKELATTLENLGKETTTTNIDADIADALDKIVVLQEKLKEIGKGVEVPIKPKVEPTATPYTPGGQDDGSDLFGGIQLARGGTVRGPGGIDRVPAMLTAGEEVITRARAVMFRPLLKAINRGSLREIQAVADRLLSRVGSVPAVNPPAPAGPVPGFAGGGTAEITDYGVMGYQIGGRPVRRVSGPYEALRGLADDIALLKRGGGR